MSELCEKKNNFLPTGIPNMNVKITLKTDVLRDFIRLENDSSNAVIKVWRFKIEIQTFKVLNLSERA
jgi:hypothetical protein